MNRKDRSTIHSVVTQDDLQSFISAYCIPSNISPHLSGPSEPATCSSKHMVIYSFVFILWFWLPHIVFQDRVTQTLLVPLQVHPLAFLRIVHFELTCVAFDGAPSVPFFRRFYRLSVDGDWFTFEKRKGSVSPCYSFMPTSTYPKQWKNKFIFVSLAMLLDSLPCRDPSIAIEDEAPPVSVVVLYGS
ncbi:hypothetical protein Hdeb2414_s0030g00708331 [Helianthus debilis subsp. tardiflorus]